MLLRSSIFISLFLFLFSFSIYADGNWCIQDPKNPPCNGAPGRCTRNFDGSEGGFVAETAYVELVMVGGLSRNRPHIGLHVSICDAAMITGNAKVSGNARVHEEAQVYGAAWVFGNSQVYGNARVFGDAQVYGAAEVSGDARVYGDEAQVYGDARVFGDAQILGDARISEHTVISTGNYGF